MTEINIDAIVIGSTEINEKDKMIRAISKNGYISFFAKGVSSVKSKNASSLTTFSKSNFTLFVSPKGNYSLKTGLLRKSYFSLTSYSEMSICSMMEEVSKLFINETSDSSFYEVIENSLERISNGEDPILVGTSFLCTVLKNEGSLPPKLPELFEENQNNLYNSLKNQEPHLTYKKSDIVAVLCELLNYIESAFSVTLRTKDLIKIL